MPVIYRCGRCGKIIYVFKKVGQTVIGVPSPSELAIMFDGVCPYCGKPLNTKPDPLKDIKVYGRRAPKELIKEIRNWWEHEREKG